MSVQVRKNNLVVPFILSGEGVTDIEAVLSQDAGRSAVLAHGTLMAKIAATQKWEPFTDETATDGTAIPLGIYVGNEVTAAALVAGDVSDAAILVGRNVTIDINEITIENSLTLATVINATGGADNIHIQTVRDYMANIGMYFEGTVAITSVENT